MNQHDPSLQIAHLSKRYGRVPVFSDVSLSVASGEFVAIMGESGVGKSTLLNCMAGLDTWDAGSVHGCSCDAGWAGIDCSVKPWAVGLALRAICEGRCLVCSSTASVAMAAPVANFGSHKACCVGLPACSSAVVANTLDARKGEALRL